MQCLYHRATGRADGDKSEVFHTELAQGKLPKNRGNDKTPHVLIYLM